MGLLEDTETKITRPVDGKDRDFVFLNAYDRAELLRADLQKRLEARAVRKQKLVDNLKLAGIGGEQMYAELEAFDEKDPVDVTDEDWVNFVNSPLTIVEFYRASLAKTYGDEAAAIAKQVMPMPVADIAKIAGLQLVTRSADQVDENPQGPAFPATYSETPAPGIETGSTTAAA